MLMLSENRHMTNTNSKYSFWQTHLVALVYIMLVAYVGIAGAVQGLSNYYADSAISYGSSADADLAISLQPGNPNAYKTRGLINLRNRDFTNAANDFEHAIAFRDSDYDLWLLLGYAHSELGDTLAASDCYQRAILLAPRYSQPNFDMGMLLLKESQPELAFEFLSTAAEYDPELYPSVLDLARKSFPNNAEAIENSVRPRSIDAKKITARYFIKHGLMTENVKAFLFSDELTGTERNELISLLISKEDFSLARNIWLEGRKIESSGRTDPIFDGGFERISESEPGGFGWQIDQKATGLSVSLDEKDVHGGKRSLRLKFNGNVEVDRALISQLVVLEPFEKYELRFYARSTELISAGLPVILIKDQITSEVLGRSDKFQPSKGQWIEVRTTFVTKRSSAVSIVLLRPGCNVNPCPIFGDLGLDDLSVMAADVPRR